MNSLPLLLHVGFHNFVVSERIIALIDARIAATRKILALVKDSGPECVIDLARGRKARTVLILTGNRYIISAIPRLQLTHRLGFDHIGDSAEDLERVPAGPKLNRLVRKTQRNTLIAECPDPELSA